MVNARRNDRGEFAAPCYGVAEKPVEEAHGAFACIGAIVVGRIGVSVQALCLTRRRVCRTVVPILSCG